MVDRAAAGPPSGRFAPSPTGPLHFGSLVAAVGSCLSARSRQGRWMVRIDDLDPPREAAGATCAILGTLERYGLAWDGPVIYQARRLPLYEAALAALAASGATYPCSCSRREIAAAARSGPGGPIYPGSCRNGPRHPRRSTAIRVRVDHRPVTFHDGLYGARQQDLAGEHGDFVIRRRDGLIAYHLATVVDDAEMGITEVVRGADLLDLTPPQLHLQRLLGYPPVRYLHLPIVIAADGRKLSKQTGAHPLDAGDPRPSLVAALDHLGQQPPAGLRGAPLDAIWRWAITHWDPALLSTAARPEPVP